MYSGLKVLKRAPLLVAACVSCFASPVFAFVDTQNHWAKACIGEMASRNLATGYPDGTFRPEGTITRAEFAVLMLNAFPDAPKKRGSATFKDVPSRHWAYRAIQDAYQREFFTGYPNREFKPEQPIPRVQAIAVLADALNYRPSTDADATLREYYLDAAAVPAYAKGAIAAASLNSLVANYPSVQQLQPNRAATRGEVAALVCRASSLYVVPPEYIAGVTVRQQPVRPLPGQLDRVPTFNSNSPELVREEGILLSTFPGTNKRVPNAHLNYAFIGRFDIFSHHIARAETPAELRPFYQGIIVNNPGDRAVTVEVLQAASYLGTPDAPFIDLPDRVENPDGTVYSGPGSRVAGEVLRGLRQDLFPAQLVIPPGESRMLMNLPIAIERIPASNGRSTLMRLSSDGPVYVANLAMRATSDRAPSLAEWQEMLVRSGLAGPRDSTPTPLDPPKHPTVFGRVAGVSQGSQWTATLTDNPSTPYLSLPQSGQAVSYALGTVHLITLTTQQIQSAKMLARYPDTAYYAHSNYGIEYNLTVPLKNTSDRAQTAAVLLETPLKDEGGTDKLLFTNPFNQRPFFRGTLKVAYTDDRGATQTRYIHIVQRRGQQGKPLVTFDLPPGTTREVKVDFIYPADVTPPQVLTVRTLEQ